MACINCGKTDDCSKTSSCSTTSSSTSSSEEDESLSNSNETSASTSSGTCEDSIPFTNESFTNLRSPFKFFEEESEQSKSTSLGNFEFKDESKTVGSEEDDISLRKTSVLKNPLSESSDKETSTGSASSTSSAAAGKVVQYMLSNGEKREALLHFLLENFYSVKESDKTRLYYFMMELAKSGVIDPKTLMMPPNTEFKEQLVEILNDVDRDHPVVHPIILLPANTNLYAQDFEEVGFLGKGGFGSVVVARKRIDGMLYAVKKVKFRDSLDSVKNFEKVLREVKALAQLDHVNVLRYYHAWVQLEDCGAFESPVASPQLHRDNNGPLKINKVHNYRAARDINFGIRGGNKQSHSIHNTISSAGNGETSGSKSELSDEDLDTNNEDGSIDGYYSGSGNGDATTLTFHSTNDGHNRANMDAMPLVPYRHPTCRLPNAKKRYVMYIQMQYCEGKTLKNFLEKSDRCVNYVDNVRMFTQIAAGLHHVHARGLIHRDMKPDNIFLTKDGIIKIGDFGLAKQIQEISLKTSAMDSISSSASSSHTAGIGTRSYMSPEQCNGCLYNEKADIYSLGIILYELFSKFGTHSERARKLQDLKQGIVDQTLWVQYPNVAALVTRMIHPNPDNRPSTSDILESSFVNLYQAPASSDTELYALLQKQQEEICQLRNKLAEQNKATQ